MILSGKNISALDLSSKTSVKKTQTAKIRKSFFHQLNKPEKSDLEGS